MTCHWRTISPSDGIRVFIKTDLLPWRLAVNSD
jgi:hypothetical protein